MFVPLLFPLPPFLAPTTTRCCRRSPAPGPRSTAPGGCAAELCKGADRGELDLCSRLALLVQLGAFLGDGCCVDGGGGAGLVRCDDLLTEGQSDVV